PAVRLDRPAGAAARGGDRDARQRGDPAGPAVKPVRVTPAERKREPGPDAPRPSWISSRKRMVRPRIGLRPSGVTMGSLAPLPKPPSVLGRTGSRAAPRLWSGR